MVLKTQNYKFDESNTRSFATKESLLETLEAQPEFKEKLCQLFDINQDFHNIINIANSKNLIDSLVILDSQVEKIDLQSKIRFIELIKMLDSEKAIFEVSNIENEFILKTNKSDILLVKSVYSAKKDLLDIYSLSKFADYCRDNEYEDLIKNINKYLSIQNIHNEDEVSLRLLYKKDSDEYYLRAITSIDNYKNFGINFSVFVALIALNKYVRESNNTIRIDSFKVTDSTIYLSFAFAEEITVKDNLKLSFRLILENDEIKRNSVSFSGVFKLTFQQQEKASEIFIRPKGIMKKETTAPVDLLTYRHSGNIETVFDKIQQLPELIDFFINQVKEDSIKISEIENPDGIRKFIANKIKYSRNKDFKKYKAEVFKKLMNVTAHNTFSLFEILRSVEDLFENDDINSRDYWRENLYQALIKGF